MSHFNREGGFFKAQLLFPKEYPQKPPKMKFTSEMSHPKGKWFNGTLKFKILLKQIMNYI